MSERSDVPQHDRFADDAHRYALSSRLATGGMGEVWRARDTVLSRPVAVKLLKAEYADDRLFRQRFETEAQHAASLHHPGIAAVFDFGEAAPLDGSQTPRPYLVMELVEGQPLSDLLRPSSPMDPEVTRDLMAQTADALGAAHAAGIVHRDVKPGNLIVTPDRRVKVTDFGIARAAEGLALTETGQVLGTPAYLSPEQAEGGTATAASDVYSLGVVAYECLAGRRPFVAESAVATALAHLRQPVPELPSHVPAPLAAVVTRALAKDPHQRYADAPAFAAALRDPSSATPTAPVAAAAPVPTPAPASAPTQVLPVTPAGAIPVAAATPPQQPTPREPGGQRSGGWVPWALLAAVVVVAGLVIWQLVAGDDASEQAAEDPAPIRSSRTQTEPPSETSAPTPTETPSETPTETPSETASETPTVELDPADYVGRDVDDVEQELRELDLDVSTQEVTNPGDQGEGIVESVEPSGTLEEGSAVLVGYYGAVPDDGGEGQDGAPGNSEGNSQGNDQGEGNG